MDPSHAPPQDALALTVAASRRDLLRRVRLRWLVLSLTSSVMLCFAVVAAVNQRAAPIALAGAMIVAVNGITWLLILRNTRVRLRRHGYRW